MKDKLILLSFSGTLALLLAGAEAQALDHGFEPDVVPANELVEGHRAVLHVLGPAAAVDPEELLEGTRQRAHAPLPPVATGGRYDALTRAIGGGDGIPAVGGVIRPGDTVRVVNAESTEEASP